MKGNNLLFAAMDTDKLTTDHFYLQPHKMSPNISIYTDDVIYIIQDLSNLLESVDNRIMKNKLWTAQVNDTFIIFPIMCIKKFAHNV